MKKLHVFLVFLMTTLAVHAGFVLSTPMTSNTVVGAPTNGQVPLFTNGQWGFQTVSTNGSGGGVGSQTPWTNNENAAGFSLTNVAAVQATASVTTPLNINMHTVSSKS